MIAKKINSLFKPLYETKKRYVLITGGRGSLKSTTVHDFIVRLTFEKGHGILFTRYTMTSAEKSIIPEFKSAITSLGVQDHFHFSGNTVTNTSTGSFIYFSGIKTSSGDQTANLKSIHGITTWVVEEGEDFNDEKKFETIDDSIRSTTAQNRVIWIMNPTTKEHFIYKKWMEETNKKENYYGYDVTMSTNENVEHIHTTYHEAMREGYLTKSWTDKAYQYQIVAEKAEKKEKGSKYKTHYYYNYIGGWLERHEGAIFDNWIEGEFNTRIPYCYGLDWGYSPDPLAMVKVAVDRKNMMIYVKQIIYDTEINDVESEIRASSVNKSELIVCDTSEPRTRSNLHLSGWNIQNAVKNQIKDDIREMKKYTIVVDPNSNNIKSEFNNYVWNDKKSSIPIDAWNHACDSIRYAFVRLTVKQVYDNFTGKDNLL